MEQKIRLLPDDLINKIAAGEVIENPSSVVKELVENAVDAKATEIQVDIKAGGRQLIRITDNGMGMSQDDALLAIERHATSKVTDFQDFELLQTMGFRGEAVPSIASISRFSLLTNAGSALEEASLLLVEGGKLIKQAPALREKGTTIEVKELFFNVPVRKKFQRSPAYDVAEISKVLLHRALVHPEISWTLTKDGERLLYAPKEEGGSFAAHEARLRRLYSHEWVEGALPLQSANRLGWNLFGWVGAPTATRPNKQGQLLFINKRPVTSPLLAKAVKEGYGTLLPPGRYPSFVLHLELPPALVDVNVHPQKKEVRLRQGEELVDFLRQQVSALLRPVPKAPPEIPKNTPQPTLRLQEVPESFSLSFPQPAEEKPPAQREFTFEPKESSPPKKQVVATVPGYFFVLPIGERKLFAYNLRRAHLALLLARFTGKEEKVGESLAIPLELSLSTEEECAVEIHMESLQKQGFMLAFSGPQTLRVEGVPALFSKSSLEPMIREVVALLLEEECVELQWDQRALKICREAAHSSKTTLSTYEAQILMEQLIEIGDPKISHHGEKIWEELSPTALEQIV